MGRNGQEQGRDGDQGGVRDGSQQPQQAAGRLHLRQVRQGRRQEPLSGGVRQDDGIVEETQEKEEKASERNQLMK